ncbi:MAG: hypothetical protein PVH19_08540, partial [Planctomycetia bacterium]
MKGHISVSIVALTAVAIWSSWNSVTQAQGYQSRRTQWQQRVLQDTNPGMTPAAAFGDEPLLAQREYPLNPVPSNGTGQAPSVLDPVGPTHTYNDCGCGGSSCNECGDCGDCCDCGPTCGPTCDACVCGSCECCCYDQYTGLIPPGTFCRLLRRCEFFGGVHAFKGPVDQGSNGNFGFHGGVNLGGALGGYNRNGYQLGVSVTGSDYSGSTIMGEDTGDRKQLFFTG